VEAESIIWASLRVIAPTGQYDPTKIVNWGINRWAFKPEFGYSERWGNWMLDTYAGVWFYTTNQACGPVGKPQNESPIGSFEGHFSNDFKRPGTWVSFDGNFWWGGLTSLSGIRNLTTEQVGSRIGGTAAWRFISASRSKASTALAPSPGLAVTTRTCRLPGSIRGWVGLRGSET
jgi:hypothetical protein